jgi:hypothetical protein
MHQRRPARSLLGDDLGHAMPDTLGQADFLGTGIDRVEKPDGAPELTAAAPASSSDDRPRQLAEHPADDEKDAVAITASAYSGPREHPRRLVEKPDGAPELTAAAPASSSDDRPRQVAERPADDEKDAVAITQWCASCGAGVGGKHIFAIPGIPDPTGLASAAAPLFWNRQPR